MASSGSDDTSDGGTRRRRRFLEGGEAQRQRRPAESRPARSPGGGGRGSHYRRHRPPPRRWRGRDVGRPALPPAEEERTAFAWRVAAAERSAAEAARADLLATGQDVRRLQAALDEMRGALQHEATLRAAAEQRAEQAERAIAETRERGERERRIAALDLERAAMRRRWAEAEAAAEAEAKRARHRRRRRAPDTAQPCGYDPEHPSLLPR